MKRRSHSRVVCVFGIGLTLLSPPAAAQPAEVPALYGSRTGNGVAVGAWLGSEPLPRERGLASAATQLRFIYGSTDGLSGTGPVVVSGALFLPAGSAPESGWPVVAWAHGTVGIADHCAPSVAGRSPRDQEYLNKWLRAGYAIVATDYQGLGTPGPHPYLNNRAAAYSVLDAVRAARGVFPQLADRVLIVGQSQGAAAAISTAALAPAYAPDVNVVGTIATGVPNVEASLSRANQTARDAEAFDPAVAYLMYLAAAATEADPEGFPEGAVTTRGQPAIEAARELCAQPMLQYVRDAGLTQLNAVTPAFLLTFADPVRALHYPHLALSQPLFVGMGEQDVDTPTAGQREIAEEACRRGTVVQTRLYAGRDHSTALNQSFPDAVEFARKAVAGEPLDVQCSPPSPKMDLSR